MSGGVPLVFCGFLRGLGEQLCEKTEWVFFKRLVKMRKGTTILCECEVSSLALIEKAIVKREKKS